MDSRSGRISRRVSGLLCAAAILAGGCSHLPPGVFVAEGFAAPGTPYGDALLKYTRRAELYEGVGTVAKGWATWESPELLRVLEEASRRAFGADQPAGAPTGGHEGEGGALVFHLAFYTPKRQWNDLESAGSLWRAHLITRGGADTAPLRVEVVAKTEKSPVQYPHVTPWTREYRLVFPAPASDAGPPTLTLAGPLGKMRFEF